jgi:hypothetical protein
MINFRLNTLHLDDPRFVYGLQGLLVLCFAWQLLAWYELFHEKRMGFFSVPSTAPGSSLNRSQVTTQAALPLISNVHVFGEAKLDLASTENAPKTTLPLKLKGIIAGQGRKKKVAIIAGASPGDQKEKAYHIGDRVSEGVAVVEILTDRVILKRNGHFENLFFTVKDLSQDAYHAPARRFDLGVRPILPNPPGLGLDDPVDRLDAASVLANAPGSETFLNAEEFPEGTGDRSVEYPSRDVQSAQEIEPESMDSEPSGSAVRAKILQHFKSKSEPQPDSQREWPKTPDDALE